MGAVADAFWRACAYCAHPRVLVWSLLPMAVAALLVAGLGYAFWEPAVDGVRGQLQAWALAADALRWLDARGWQSLRVLLGPLVVVALSLPVLVVTVLLLVTLLALPGFVRLVARRRFAALQAHHGAGRAQVLGWSLACAAAALAALAASVPLWLLPPLVLLLPPLIWGWLASRVLAFGVLARHATAAERRHLLRRRRWTWLAMGLVCGALGLLPSLLWAAGAATLIVAPLLALAAVWLYTAVFAFAGCWFAHYGLAELAALRAAGAAAPAGAVRVEPTFAAATEVAAAAGGRLPVSPLPPDRALPAPQP